MQQSVDCSAGSWQVFHPLFWARIDRKGCALVMALEALPKSLFGRASRRKNPGRIVEAGARLRETKGAPTGRRRMGDLRLSAGTYPQGGTKHEQPEGRDHCALLICAWKVSREIPGCSRAQCLIQRPDGGTKPNTRCLKHGRYELAKQSVPVRRPFTPRWRVASITMQQPRNDNVPLIGLRRTSAGTSPRTPGGVTLRHPAARLEGNHHPGLSEYRQASRDRTRGRRCLLRAASDFPSDRRAGGRLWLLCRSGDHFFASR